MLCECPHEDCGVTFIHHGSTKETTCCPQCGRQQMPHPAQNFTELVKEEIAKARRKHPQTYPSAHYFYGVIAEEVDEFWDLVKSQNPSKEEMLKELVQIGAMAQRAAEDIGLIEIAQEPLADLISRHHKAAT